MNETLEVGGLLFEVRRSTRRKTLGLTVDRGGELVIHAPTTTDQGELTRWTRLRLLWVHRKLALKEELVPQVREPEFVSGESFSYLGRSYRLQVVAEQALPLRFDGRRFYLRRAALSSATEHFRSWFIGVGKKWIAERIAFLAGRVGVAPSRVEIRELGYRWGSCGKNRVAYFNWKMLQLPVRLADYVIAHELAHLVEPHHGPQFSRLLDRSLPDWRERQQELQVKAAAIHWCGANMGQRGNLVRRQGLSLG